MGDPIKKVDLDDILRKKVGESKFSFSEEHWNKLNLELTKQREKRSAFKGIILLLQNRWVQSGLVAAVAVFATYLFMTNFSSDAVKQPPHAQNTPAVQAPSNLNNSTAPLTSENNVATDNTTNELASTGNDNAMNVPANTPNNGGTNGTLFKQDNNSIATVTKQDEVKNEATPEKNPEKVVEVGRKPLLALEVIDTKDVTILPQEKELPVADIDNNTLKEFYASTAPDSTNSRDKFKMFAFEGIGIKAGTSVSPTYSGSSEQAVTGSTVGLFTSFALTPKFSLQAEVLYTQVKGHSIQRTETKGETIYTDNGVGSYSYSERFVDISGMNYFRFPVLIKYKVTNKLAIGAGGYYSRLESPIGSEIETRYDGAPTKSANDNYLVQPTVTSAIPDQDVMNSNSYGAVPTQASGLRQYDAGLVFDAEYRIKRWSIGTRFNQGITDITPDDIYKVNKIHKTNTTTEITIGFLF